MSFLGTFANLFIYSEFWSEQSATAPLATGFCSFMSFPSLCIFSVCAGALINTHICTQNCLDLILQMPASRFFLCAILPTCRGNAAKVKFKRSGILGVSTQKETHKRDRTRENLSSLNPEVFQRSKPASRPTFPIMPLVNFTAAKCGTELNRKSFLSSFPLPPPFTWFVSSVDF